MIRNTANAQTYGNCDEAIKVLKESDIWKSKAAFSKWFNETWLSCKSRWVKAYLSKEFDVMVTTTNGVESLNKLLKYSFLPHSEDRTLSSLAKILIEEYYPSAIKKYYASNVKFSGINRTFNNQIPDFMHGRPTSFIKQCFKSYKAALLDFQDSHTEKLILSSNFDTMVFQVRSAFGSTIHTVDWKKPCCSCHAFTNFKPYPCKHFFILILMLPEVTWDNLPNVYRNQSLFTADKDLPEINICNVNKELVGDKLSDVGGQEVTNNELLETSDNNVLNDLPIRIKSARKPIMKTISYKLDTIKTNMHLCHDVSVLENVSALLEECKFKLELAIPKEENLNLEADESNIPTQKQPGRKRKDWRHRNRVGKKAETYRSSYKVDVPLPPLDLTKKTMKTPRWGGKVKFNNSLVNFTLTCPVDNWLVYMQVSGRFYEEVLDKCKDRHILEAYTHVLKDQYNEAKMKIALLNSLKINNSLLDFYGNEEDLFMNHFGFISCYTTTSTCSSKDCPNDIKQSESKQIPKITINQLNIEEKLQEWFKTDGQSKCGLLFSEQPNEDAPCYTSTSAVINDL